MCRWVKDDVFGAVLRCNRKDDDLIILDPVDYGAQKQIPDAFNPPNVSKLPRSCLIVNSPWAASHTAGA